jgi:uncharacterized protein involved in outer membrane biogenesis
MARHQKILIGIAVAFLFYSVAGFWVLPTVLKDVLEKKLSENLKRTVSIKTIQINPYLLKVSINNFQVKDTTKDEIFVAFDRLFVDLELVSLIKRALVVDILTLTGPRLNLARYKDHSYNFSDLATSSESAEKTNSKPFLFSVNNIEIKNGTIFFHDKPKETTHRVANLNIAIPFLSNVAHEVEITVQPAFSALINDTPVNLTGETIPFHDTRTTVFEIQLNKLNIPEYLAYIPPQGDMTLKSGNLDISAVLGFEMQPGKKPLITLTGDFSLKEIDVAQIEGESYLTIPQLDFTILDSKPMELEFHLAHISIHEPHFLLRRSRNGDILPLVLLQKKSEAQQTDQAPQDKDTAFKLIVDEIALNRGSIRFDDKGNAEPFEALLNPVEITIKGLSTRENEESVYEVSMLTAAGESIAMNGTLSLNPIAAQFHAALQDLKIPRYSPYYSEIITPRVVGGNLDLAADISFIRKENQNSLNAENITLLFDSIAVNDKNNAKLLAVPSLSIRETSLDLDGQQLIVGDLSVNSGELHLVRQEEGLIILKELFRPRKEQKEEMNRAKKDAALSWITTLQKGKIDKFSIVLLDHIPAEPTTVVIDNMRLDVENFSTAENTKGEVALDLRIDKKGIFSLKGEAGVKPFSGSLAVTLAKLPVKTLQPYFAERVDLVIGDGVIGGDGQLTVSQDKGKVMSTQFRGKGVIEKFASSDPLAGEEFLKWKELRLGGVEYDSSTFALRIKEIIWQDFYNKIALFDDGTLNLQTIIKSPDESDSTVRQNSDLEKPMGEQYPLFVKIDTVKLENGKFDFLDRKISPHYAASLSELMGTITGLSSQVGVMAEADISGKLDQQAPLHITGRLNPLSKEVFADITVDFKNIELSPTTPYTGKYIGYRVEKGKLSLELKYLVEARKITGKNKAFLDQFTLGETVESPDSLNLPINLAIALLKNRNGEITLNVPVQGDLDDPEFSIGSIVFKAIVNLIAKAATSPFALLGALIPEGEELQYVEFASGSSLLEEKHLSGLEIIAKALHERPALKMDISGSVAFQQEKEVLHNLRFENLLKNEKYKKLSRKKDETISLNDIIIKTDEYETYLKAAYKEASFDKPQNILGLTKRMPPEEMEKLLHENITITENDLRLLAIERANAVKSFLIEAGPVEPDRLFIIEPDIAEDKSTDSRVEMTIK